MSIGGPGTAPWYCGSMLARSGRIVGETLSLALAALTLGCGQQQAHGDEDTSTSSETGEDTDSTPAECPTAGGLTVHEGLSGEAISAVMFPASGGGTNSVTGSCGGGGIDATYLVTARETSYYNLSMEAQELGSATFHIHAGDSCDGPELYCATGSFAEFELMLAEGENVIIVVDTEADLVIPEGGLRYQVSMGLASPPPEPCYPDELHACTEASAQALQSCMATYTCGDFAKAAMCIDEFGGALEPCFDEFCPDGPEILGTACLPGCDNRRTSCGTENGCDANTCEYEWQLCMDACTPCTAVQFPFAYEGACELTLPGPPGPHHGVSIYIAGQEYPVSEPGLACADPDATDVVWQSTSTLLLCAPACEAFTMAAVAYASPSCE
jgi:hypothetical protein